MVRDSIPHAVGVPLHGGDVRAPADVFNSIFEVFLILGTAVGIVVVCYTMYHALKYRESSADDADPYADVVERPQLGELPTGGKGGRKVFYSFGISAIIVISLIAWTYTTLLYVENGPDDAAENINSLEIDVEGFRFGWSFTYPNGHETSRLVVPQDRVIRLRVTSTDVFHNFGIPELRVKTDAIPGQTTDVWFTAPEVRNYTAQCYELCGSGHSVMVAPVEVVSKDDYREWYSSTNGTSSNATSDNSTQAGSNATSTASGDAAGALAPAAPASLSPAAPASNGGTPA